MDIVAPIQAAPPRPELPVTSTQPNDRAADNARAFERMMQKLSSAKNDRADANNGADNGTNKDASAQRVAANNATKDASAQRVAANNATSKDASAQRVAAKDSGVRSAAQPTAQTQSKAQPQSPVSSTHTAAKTDSNDPANAPASDKKSTAADNGASGAGNGRDGASSGETTTQSPVAATSAQEAADAAQTAQATSLGVLALQTDLPAVPAPAAIVAAVQVGTAPTEIAPPAAAVAPAAPAAATPNDTIQPATAAAGQTATVAQPTEQAAASAAATTSTAATTLAAPAVTTVIAATDPSATDASASGVVPTAGAGSAAPANQQTAAAEPAPKPGAAKPKSAVATPLESTAPGAKPAPPTEPEPGKQTERAPSAQDSHEPIARTEIAATPVAHAETAPPIELARTQPMQIRNLDTATAATTTDTALVAVPKNAALAASTVAQVGFHLSRADADGQQNMTINLRPEELGSITVKLDIKNGVVHAHVVADRSDTLDLLRSDPRGLQRALDNAGMNTDGGSLSFDLRQNGQGSQHGNQTARNDASGDELNSEFDLAVVERPRLAADGRVDVTV
ncbi:MAG: putative Flagellar hook-length control protein FliK [Rhodospirillales bacterium]|nr:putative Flagellar hook-length control protein FliK [Rhodospirillales bacterium]